VDLDPGHSSNVWIGNSAGRDTGTMFRNTSRGRLIGAWCATLAVFGAGAVAVGPAFSVANGALMLLAGLMPLAVVLLVWRGAPPVTVAELLHAVDGPSTGGRS
jgi:hypothetical protein